MSDPFLSDINIKNEMAWVWTTLKISTDSVYLKIFRILIKVSAVGIIALTLLSTEAIVQVVQPRFDQFQFRWLKNSAMKIENAASNSVMFNHLK